MQPTDNINIALSFDEHYTTPFYTLLASIFLNNTSKSTFHFHFIATGLSDQEAGNFRQYIHQNKAEVDFYFVSPSDLEGLVLPQGQHYTLAAYYKLFFPLLLPEHEKKLLYLDVDIIVNGDLAELYATEVTGVPVAVVPEYFNTTPWPHLGIYETGKYFNSGVLLINLKEWRKQKITEKALQFLRDFPDKILWVDQDALNAVLANNYLPLEVKYNLNTNDIPTDLTHKGYKKYASDKVIIHYTGPYKPWNVFSQHPLRYLYFNFLKYSPKAKSSKYTNFQPTRRILWFMVKLKIKEVLVDYLGPRKHWYFLRKQ